MKLPSKTRDDVCSRPASDEAAAAGHRVGYESPSQFSREYRRLFGAPPRQEIAAMRTSQAMI
jgi:AraC-like DNA-binding protein